MPLVGLVASIAIEVGHLLLESSLVDMGRVASTISNSLEDFLPLKGSLGATRGFVVLGTTPLDVSFSFSMALACSAFLGGLEEEGGILAELPLSSTAFSGTVAV